MKRKRKNIIHDALNLKFVDTINSRTKGKTFERVVAKAFGQWAGTKFAAVPNSGGLRWKDASDTLGDITCTDRNFDFPFIIECKFYRKIFTKNDSYNLGSSSKVFKFWKQVTEDAKRASKTKIRILAVRENDMPAGRFYVVMEQKTHDALYLNIACNGEFEGVTEDGEILVGVFCDSLFSVKYVSFLDTLTRFKNYGF